VWGRRVERIAETKSTSGGGGGSGANRRRALQLLGGSSAGHDVASRHRASRRYGVEGAGVRVASGGFGLGRRGPEVSAFPKRLVAETKPTTGMDGTRSARMESRGRPGQLEGLGRISIPAKARSRPPLLSIQRSVRAAGFARSDDLQAGLPAAVRGRRARMRPWSYRSWRAAGAQHRHARSMVCGQQQPGLWARVRRRMELNHSAGVIAAEAQHGCSSPGELSARLDDNSSNDKTNKKASTNFFYTPRQWRGLAHPEG